MSPGPVTISGAAQVKMFLRDAKYLMMTVSRGEDEDWETCGRDEADLKNIFIASLAAESLTTPQILKIARCLARITKHDHPRWFS